MGLHSFRLNHQRVLVTGGSRGIGLAIAAACARAGADLALVARDARALRAAAARLRAGGRTRIDAFVFDLGDTRRIDVLYARILRRTGGVDVLVNNAGITARGPAETVTPAQWDAVLRVNLTAVFRLCQAFARDRIARQQPGKIVNIASLLSECVRRDNSPYAAAKGGIRQLTKSLAVDWARHRITVNAIGPGYIRTDLTRPLQDNAAFNRWVLERTPLGRWGVPEDIAGAAVFLASPAADFITGQILYVDGGILSAV